MSICMRELSPDTYKALQDICWSRGWAEIQGYMEPETVAWLAIRLEFVTDDEENFPRGKWATIQRLVAMLRKFAENEI